MLSAEGGVRFSKGAYTLGKVVPGKGWEELLAMLDFHQRTVTAEAAVAQPSIDAYGSGEAFETVWGAFPSLLGMRAWLVRTLACTICVLGCQALKALQ
jgi:hypothetical protein